MKRITKADYITIYRIVRKTSLEWSIELSSPLPFDFAQDGPSTSLRGTFDFTQETSQGFFANLLFHLP